MAKSKRKDPATELNNIIIEFSMAMQSASPDYIAETGRMTLRMKDIWAKYVEWCVNHK